MVRERRARRNRPVSQADGPGCEQVANKSTGAAAVLSRMIPISFDTACVTDEDKKGRNWWKTGCTSKRGFYSLLSLKKVLL